jgi:hypothetical protein
MPRKLQALRPVSGCPGLILCAVTHSKAQSRPNIQEPSHARLLCLFVAACVSSCRCKALVELQLINGALTAGDLLPDSLTCIEVRPHCAGLHMGHVTWLSLGPAWVGSRQRSTATVSAYVKARR